MDSLTELRAGTLDGARTLKLCEGLTDFPQEIFRLADTLEQLDLSGNHLSTLPSNLPSLKRLRVLFLSNNQFSSVPEVLADCSELFMLGMRANQLTWIPEGALPEQLGWLILPANKITNLPRSIGRLRRLRKFGIAGNHLTSLPQEMSDCHGLELLRIAVNRIERLPEWLLMLPKLSWLGFAGNPCSDGNWGDGSLPQLSWQQLVPSELLGQGSSGVTYEAMLRQADRAFGVDERTPLALKVFKRDLGSDGLPRDEARAIAGCGDHVNIIRAFARVTGEPEGRDALLLERVPPRFKALAQPPSFSSCTRDVYPAAVQFAEAQVRRILVGICSAMEHLHTRKILHGDLYGHNILVDSEGLAKLGDFGAATPLGSASTAVANQLQQIEVRAFACLAEELIERSSESGAFGSLLAGVRRCFDPNVANRPLFAELRSIINQ